MFDDEIHPNENGGPQNFFVKDLVQHINKNKDERTKHVGDQVLVWDTSRLTEFETDNPVDDLLDERIITHHPSIVIETNCKYDATLYIGKRPYILNLDLKIWNKTLNRVYRTYSNFVKIIK